MILTQRDAGLLLAARPFASAPTTPGASGVGGVAIYRSVDAEGGDPPAIRYRHLRFTRAGGQALQRSHRRKTEAEALIGQPATETTLAVVAGASYRIQVRAWRDDVENPQTYGERVLIVDDDGDTEPIFEGSGYVLNVVKRENGGMLVRVVWNSPAASPPETLTLTKVSGPASIDDVVLTWSASQRVYTFLVSDIGSESAHTFRVYAEKDGYTIRATVAVDSVETDFEFTPDATGPSAVSSLTIREA